MTKIIVAYQSEGLSGTNHFTFTGDEQTQATAVILDKTLEVREWHQGKPDLRLIADSRTWLRFLGKEANLVWALVTRKVRLHGSPRLLLAFGRCFRS